MAVEIERKWVAREVPSSLPDEHQSLRQGYLAQDSDVTVRVRIAESDAWLTVKAGGDGLSRTEVELPVPVDDAEQLWPHTAGRRVEKRRYRVPVGDVVAEVDVFAGNLEGLCLVEVEFDSGEKAAAFKAPEWFGREVTSRPEWSNASLATHGRPADP